MHDAGDMELLREYDRQGSEAAFAALVQRHVSLVYSAALRHVGIAAHAEEITQAVFVILARKAASLRPDIILESWLYETTRLTALSFRRGERRRQFREQEAYMQSTLQESADASTWNQLAPLLDEAMARLGKKDRDAVLLRFFKNKNLREVAAALKVNETAAQKRVHRAVGKLRAFFTKRGIIFPAAVLTAAISANSVQAAPVALAKTVTAVAIAKGATASISTLTLIKGALKIMAWTKMQTAVVVGVGVLLAAGTTTVVFKSFDPVINDSFFNTEYHSLLATPSNILIIRPTHFANGDAGSYWLYAPINKAVGRDVSFKDMLVSAYDWSASRMVFTGSLPSGEFDYLITKPRDAKEALQNQLKKQFGLVGRKEVRETDVLLLQLKIANAPGLSVSAGGNGYTSRDQNRFSGTNQPVSTLAAFAEGIFSSPVLDQTGLTNNLDFNLAWSIYGKKLADYPNHYGLKKAFLDQLGLELVPTNMPIEMLVVEKVK